MVLIYSFRIVSFRTFVYILAKISLSWLVVFVAISINVFIAFISFQNSILIILIYIYYVYYCCSIGGHLEIKLSKFHSVA